MAHGKQHNGQFVAYYRVSTQRQGHSGLGLEAQQQSVRQYLNGGDWKLVAEFTEVESGKRNQREQLQAALDLCRRTKAKLIIAKLDRLSRNYVYLRMLEDSGVSLCAVDMSEVDTDTAAGRAVFNIMASMAQFQRDRISEDTIAALAAAKARGVKLGGPKLAEARVLATQAVIGNADRFARNVVPIVREIQAAGITTLVGVADALNARGIKTRQDRKWYATQVKNLLARVA